MYLNDVDYNTYEHNFYYYFEITSFQNSDFYVDIRFGEYLSDEPYIYYSTERNNHYDFTLDEIYFAESFSYLNFKLFEKEFNVLPNDYSSFEEHFKINFNDYKSIYFSMAKKFSSYLMNDKYCSTLIFESIFPFYVYIYNINDDTWTLLSSKKQENALYSYKYDNEFIKPQEFSLPTEEKTLIYMIENRLLPLFYDSKYNEIQLTENITLGKLVSCIFIIPLAYGISWILLILPFRFIKSFLPKKIRKRGQ